MLSLFASPPSLSVLARRELPGVEIATSSHGKEIPPFHLLPVIQLTEIVEGSTRLALGRRAFELSAGELMINAPDGNPRVLERLTPRGVSRRLLLSSEVFEGGTSLIADAIEPAAFRRPALVESVNRLQFALLATDSTRRLLQERLAGVLAELSQALRHPGPGTRALREPLRPELAATQSILRRRFHENVSLAELAQAVGLSPYHLLRLFRDQLGAPPHAYQVQLRVSHARALLAQGISVAESSLACGFADQAHFTRAFKRIVGFTPAAFARAKAPAEAQPEPNPEVKAG